MDEVKIIPSWMDSQKIEMPLTEFVAMRMTIVELEIRIKDLTKEVDEQRSEKWAAQGERDRIKADYQKLLGIKKDEEGDDKK